MKIYDGQKIADLSAYLKESSKKGGLSTKGDVSSSTSPSKVSAPVATDHVELSAKVQDLQQAGKVLEVTPEIRKDKVAEIKEQIDSGTYSVKGEAIAGRIIESSILEKFI